MRHGFAAAGHRRPGRRRGADGPALSNNDIDVQDELIPPMREVDRTGLLALGFDCISECAAWIRDEATADQAEAASLVLTEFLAHEEIDR